MNGQYFEQPTLAPRVIKSAQSETCWDDVTCEYPHGKQRCQLTKGVVVQGTPLCVKHALQHTGGMIALIMKRREHADEQH
jgi:hypothetical protein